MRYITENYFSYCLFQVLGVCLSFLVLLDGIFTLAWFSSNVIRLYLLISPRVKIPPVLPAKISPFHNFFTMLGFYLFPIHYFTPFGAEDWI